MTSRSEMAPLDPVLFARTAEHLPFFREVHPNMSFRQWVMYLGVLAKPGLNTSQFARWLNEDYNTARGGLAGLEKRGLVASTVHEDGRCWFPKQAKR